MSFLWLPAFSSELEGYISHSTGNTALGAYTGNLCACMIPTLAFCGIRIATRATCSTVCLFSTAPTRAVWCKP